MTVTPTHWYVRTKNGASGPYSTQQIKDFAANGKLPRQANIGKSLEGPWAAAENAKGLFPDKPQSENDSENSADEPMRASDYVPDVVKNSATAISSAASGITNSIVTKIRKFDAAREAKAKEEAMEAEKAKSNMVPASSTSTPVTQVDSSIMNILQPEPTRSVQSHIVQPRNCPFCTAEVPGDAIKCRYCAEFLDGRNLHPNKPVAAVAAATQHVYVHTPVARWNPGIAAVLSLIIPDLGQIYKTQILNGLLWMILVPFGYVCFIIPGLVLHLCCIIGASQGDPYR